MGHHHHHHSTSDGISQRVNSPRFSGPMTRRAHSFKRNTTNTNSDNNNNIINNTNNNNNSSSGTSTSGATTTTLSTHHEIDVNLSSPRSEMGTNPVSPDGFESSSVLERKHHHHHHHVSHRVRIHGNVIKRFLLNKPIESMVVELGLRERKKLGHWMFLLFCGLCIFLGLVKICATGWFGSAIERAGSNQVSSCKYQSSICVCIYICYSS